MKYNQPIYRFIRKLIPSTVLIANNPLISIIANGVDKIAAFLYPELKNIPPNNLRLRVGFENNILFNQLSYRYRGINFWLRALSLDLIKLDSNILDLGCGCGRTATLLKEYAYINLEYNGHYTGIDIDKEAIEWCQKNFPKETFTFIHNDIHRSKVYNPSQVGKNYKIPLEENTQDYVFGLSLFTHLLEPEFRNYLKESFRVMKKGKYLEGTIFCIDYLQEKNLLEGRWTFQHQLGKAFVENPDYPEAAVAYTKDYLVEMGKDSGFEEVEIIFIGANSWLRCRK